MKTFLLLLSLAVCAAVVSATKTVTLDRNRLSSNPPRTEMITAARAQHSMEIENCLLNIPVDSRDLLSRANSCVCVHRHTLAKLKAIPIRMEGVDSACANQTPPPSINIYDQTLNLHALCSTIGMHERWPFCGLF